MNNLRRTRMGSASSVSQVQASDRIVSDSPWKKGYEWTARSIRRRPAIWLGIGSSMYVANIGQIHKTNPADAPFDGWVVFFRRGGNTARENRIRDHHETIETELAESNVSYSEITTRRGTNDIHRRFACRDRRHPLFLILGEHPSGYARGDPFLVIEWGKWEDIEDLTDDLFTLIPLISPSELIGLFSSSDPGPSSSALSSLIEKGNFQEMTAGLTISMAMT